MRHLIAFLVVTFLCVGPACAADEAPPKTEVVKLTVHAADLPQPALKNLLRYTPLDQKPGNAALLYMKACLVLEQTKWKNDVWEKIDAWLAMPVDKLPIKEVGDQLESASSVLHLVDLAAHRESCDWGHPVREERNPFMILLPELTVLRQTARLVALRARLNLAKNDIPAALADLREGYALAVHVGNDQFLVNSLVGASIANTMNGQLQSLLERPSAPNLYWGLTDLPDPLIGMRKALDFEAIGAYLAFPELQKALGAPMSEAEAVAGLQSILAQISQIATLNESSATGGSTGGGGSVAFAAALLLQAPQAKQRLIASGRSAKEVEKMPVTQVVLADMAVGFAEYRDDMFKWFALPYPQAAPGVADAEARLRSATEKARPIPATNLVLPGMLLPAIGAVRVAEARLQRDMALYRIIEALRYYAVKHDKKLPAQLGDVKDLPIPVNPFTGKAFAYRLDKDVAVMTIETPKKPTQEYRITVKK